MKKSSSRTFIVLLLAVLCLSCQTDEETLPTLSAGQTRNALLGKWRVERIDYQVCRNGNCNTTNYRGNAGDYFEFRSDSAFLLHDVTRTKNNYNAFKAEYTLPGAFILSRQFWSATYTVTECKANRLVLNCTYAGSDPYARFTDTYYLYR
ncbi:hypothetical protein [Pontibacter pudoricolor]|uniref:hypothetical protein n=1 Tax=Pontibacter pudoricolor TaxID=2694930 RepID=UPI001EE457C4|nr:hypothetical protein [Pontibacter pudoricolor]